MTEEPWRRALEDMDTEVLGAQKLAVGAFWPPIAVACALIDAGVIDRMRLLEIIDSLHALVTAEAVDDLGDPEDVGLGLEKAREFFDLHELTRGSVVRQLREMERGEAARLLLRMRRSPPGREPG